MKTKKSLILFAAIVSLWAFQQPIVFAGHHGHSKEPHGKHHKQHKHGMGSRPVEEYIRMFEDPERAKWQMPGKVVDSLKLEPGNSVADIGAGSGYFSVLFSKRVGEKGKVYAVDVEPKMVDYVKARVEKEGLKNIIPILSKLDDPLLSAGSLDVAFICDTLHHIGNRPAYLGLVAKGLKSGGRLAIVDFKKEPTAEGPPMKMRLAKDEVVREITSAGYVLIEEFDFLPYQYFLIFGREKVQ